MSEQYSEIHTDTLKRVTEIFKAFSNYNQIRLMELLSVSEVVGHISHQLNLSQSNVSHQLKLLKSVHLVKAKRQGQSMIYSLDDIHVATMLKQAIHHANHPKESGL
ncbi:Zn(II)-responsive metalloregulatory transcriptional repressor CzrA [Staphylococcus aureus]